MKHPVQGDETYYDLAGDWELVVASFLAQYGMRLATREFESVTWDEFCALLAGLSPDTPLGRVVGIRAEKDVEIIRRFSVEQKRVYDEWRNRSAGRMSDAEYERGMAELERVFAREFG